MESQNQQEQPTPEIYAWANAAKAVLSIVDISIVTLDMDEGRRALEYFSGRANHAAAIQPLSNMEPAEINTMSAEAATFRAFFKLCESRAAQIKATEEAAKTQQFRADVRKVLGL